MSSARPTSPAARRMIGAALFAGLLLMGVGAQREIAQDKARARGIDAAYAPTRAIRPAAERHALEILAQRCGLEHYEAHASREDLRSCLKAAASRPLHPAGPFDTVMSRRYDELREIWLRATMQRLEATKGRVRWPVANNEAA